MVENNATDVFAAFEILMEEIEAEVNLINNIATRAMERRDYEGAHEAIDHAAQVTAFRDKIVSLRKEWKTLTVTQGGNAEEEILSVKRRNLGRLQRGLRTPEIAYFQPILEALNELGGSAEMNAVVERVEQSMRGVLRQVDYEPLASGTEMLRWRNTAQWARNTMVEEGLLKLDSPRGIWEITEAGRRALGKEWKTLTITQGGKVEEEILPVKRRNDEPKKVTGTTPTTVTILGQSFAVHSWRDVLERTMNTLADLRPEKIEQIMRQFPRFVGRDKKRFRVARELKNGTFIEVNLSAENIQHLCFQVLETTELSAEDLVIVTV
ncbi:MAG TPA: winged helix-turn-helix domain-containing protein [Ktedonobacteraceae bacterium]